MAEIIMLTISVALGFIIGEAFLLWMLTRPVVYKPYLKWVIKMSQDLVDLQYELDDEES